MKFCREHLLIYAVTDRAWTGRMTLFEQVEAALRGGATMVQLREKGLAEQDFEGFLEEARRMHELTARYGVPLIIDDNVEIALKSGAEGVHVGQNDMNAGEVRRLLGPDRILGVTAKTVEQARRAQDAGADYLGSGAVFGTSTKADAIPMSLERLREICACVRIPVVAIGGICLENIGRLSGSGVAGAAIVSGIFGAEDIEGTTRRLAEVMRGNLGDCVAGRR
ncbi:MAG TPA: thiamine phosphate synthase [Candidatus Enterocloster excrementipullorum]|uniref:Thiamine-phosphate synthase n=1 Tax=Candidatus Enterocloster excrementipullorum TaxID=2838559 RepID=A0A9D2MYR6_9FIRM|nr:thiamine phosphate synthase [Candidatus Enterocloster excrementipullorum]